MPKRRTRARARAVMETRHSKFKRIAESRTNRALSAIHLLGNLSSGNYEYTEEELKVIRAALTDQVQKTMSLLENRVQRAARPQFKIAQAA